jgi:hypothetical protein
MSAWAIVLLVFVTGLLFYDYATLGGRSRRVLVVEAAAFAVAAFFLVFPEVSTRMAHAVGIGRGVDFVLYPLVLWLVRESLVNRQHRQDTQDALTEVVRAAAVAGARELGRPDQGDEAADAPSAHTSSGAPS